MSKFQTVTPRGNPAEIGAGNTVRLTEKQFRARHDTGRVKLVRPEGDKFICESIQPITFKVGDTFELAQ